MYAAFAKLGPSNGLAFSGNYTLSKAVDDASDPDATTYEVNLPQDVQQHGRRARAVEFRSRASVSSQRDPGAAESGEGWMADRVREELASQRHRYLAIGGAVHGPRPDSVDHRPSPPVPISAHAVDHSAEFSDGTALTQSTVRP
jgi:hypothetical protein